MQRFLLIVMLAATGTLCSAAPKTPSVHQQIAGHAATIATNLLAQDLKDEHGLSLLRFARALQPESDTVLLTMAMLERDKEPAPIKTKVTEAKLYEVIASQAKSLRLKEWPKNTKAGQLALLYYRMVERFDPDDEEIMLGLMKLRVRGVGGDLEQALEQTSSLKDIFGEPEKPAPRPKHNLTEVDRSIAKYAAIWATNRLAADASDAKGLVLLQLAGCLTPESSTVLLTQALLERGKTSAVLKSDETEEKLLDVIVSRAGKLLARELKTNKNAGQLSLLYFKVAERFRPDENKVLLGLMKLKVKGIEGELDDLLAAGPSVAARAPVREPSTTTRPEPPVTTRPVIGRPRIVAELGMALLPVKPSSFMMGSPASEADRNEDEQQHEVTLTKAFWLGKYEVTQAQYEQVMGENPSKFRGAKLPVGMVSWHKASEFCARLTEREGKAGRLPSGYEYRLPTEAEWEYSCRAGTRQAYPFGGAAGKLGSYAWDNSNSGKKTHEVGRKRANAWGFHDMLGNMWEWCRDSYGNYPDGAATDPVGSPKGSSRVNRGGSWGSGAKYCRPAARYQRSPRETKSVVGFRVALAPAIGVAGKPVERAKSKPPPGSGKPRTVAELGMDLLPVKAGSFVMGSEGGRGGQHRVKLTKAFWLGKYEVTQEQYERIMGNNPSRAKGAKLPVSRTSWFMATEFCARLTERERKAARLPKGYEYRLPTEAEWEYSCRAGTRTEYSFGDDPQKLGDYAWYLDNSPGKNREVGLKRPNAWGLHDMHGNVVEWCSDWLGAYPTGAATDPLGPAAGSGRVMRGGSTENLDHQCRAAARNKNVPTRGHASLGFRVALAPVIATK